MKKKILGIFVILMIGLSACSAAAMPASETAYDGMVMEEAAAAEYEGLSGKTANEAGMESLTDTQTGVAQALDRMVIMNADLSIIVDDPVEMVDQIGQMAVRMNGFIVSSNVWSYENSYGQTIPSGSIMVRVPSALLSAALDEIKQMAGGEADTIVSESISGQDVTLEYTDLSSRVKNLETAEEQLQTILENATTTEDVVDIFQQLTDVREKIEVYKGQMKYYEESSAYSAISVTIKAREVPQPVTPTRWNPAISLNKALQNLVSGMQGLVEILIWLVVVFLPFALIFSAPVWLFISWRKRRVKKSSSEKLETK